MTKEDLHKTIIVRLFQTSNALQTYLDQLLKPDSLTAKQFFLMIIIGTFDHDPMMGEVAERFGTSHQNVKQVLTKLARAGYLELYKDETDSRITRSRFTPKAHQYWDTRNASDEQTMDHMFESLSENELKGFLHGLVQTLEQLQMLQASLES